MPKILLLGDTYTEDDEREDRPFSGGVGHVLDAMLAQAGIPRSECKLSVVFPLRTRIEDLCTKEISEASTIIGQYQSRPKLFLHRDYEQHVKNVRRLIRDYDPDLIIAFGDVPLWLLTGQRGIGKNRGAPMAADGRKVIATYPPISVIRNWALRPVVVQDLQKALRHSADRTLRRPKRTIHVNPDLEDIASFYERYIVQAPVLSVDVETKQGQITEVGIATSVSRALVIPFWSRAARDGNYWPSLEAERKAWAWVRRILSEKPCIGQNFQYDIQYFYRTMGIPVPHYIGDTMLLHHAMQPELEKGLGFLGSIYTDEPAWKFMRTQNETLKKED